MNEPGPILLDTTLRDGSYAVDFRFTPDDTAQIVGALDVAGVAHIEIGHGLGLGAYRSGRPGEVSDAEHLAAAVAVNDNARIGTFFLPSVGREDDLKLAIDHGAHFVRIGVEVKEVAEAARAVEAARSLGFQVFLNLLKTYVVSPDKVGAYVKTASDLGAEAVYIVDSAGGMTPKEVTAYVESAREASPLAVGFHGHDNLALAVANTLAAREAGAMYLDGTLRGIGRSEGNAVTEILAALLQRDGFCLELNVTELMNASETFVKPLLDEAGHSAIGITSGLARFHSARLGSVLAAAQTYGVDPRDIILRLSDYDVTDPSQELIECVARDLKPA